MIFQIHEANSVIYRKTKRKAQSILLNSSTFTRLCLCHFGGGGRAETASAVGRVGSFPTLPILEEVEGGRAVSDSNGIGESQNIVSYP
jgi:hypothetical protein